MTTVPFRDVEVRENVRRSSPSSLDVGMKDSPTTIVTKDGRKEVQDHEMVTVERSSEAPTVFGIV